MAYFLFIVFITLAGYMLYGDIKIKRKNNALAQKVFNTSICSHCKYCEGAKADGRGGLVIHCGVLVDDDHKITFREGCPCYNKLEDKKEI